MLLMFAVNGFSQNSGYFPTFFRFTSFDGEVNLNGHYRQSYTTIGDFSESQKSRYFSGGFKLNTESYIWHPEFLILELGGEYSPGTNQDDFIVTPDYSEVRTLKGLNIGTTLFNNKPVTLRSWARWNDTYSNRENMTNIKTYSQSLGSSLRWNNIFLPVNLSFNKSTWGQTEVQTGRSWITEHENFDASTFKSFSTRDQNTLTYSYNNYSREDVNHNLIINTYNNIRLNNSVLLDKEGKYTFRSMIFDNNRKGYQFFHVFNSQQSVTMNLPKNIDIITNYNFFNQQQEFQKTRQHKIGLSLNHKLFASLNTNLQYEYVNVKQTFYHANRNIYGATIAYNKKIPKGHLNLSYNLSLNPINMVTAPVDISILNEEHILTDGEITLLDKPYIDINSVVIKDLTGSIIYQRDFDYILLERGEFVEVQRIPGGQIPNNSLVFIDYIAKPTGSYKYTVVTNNIYASVVIFKNLLELYYRGQFLDYKNVEKSDLLLLNYIKQNTFGGKITVKFIELGAELENRNSTITPYKVIRYYLKINKRVEKFTLLLNGNIRNFNMLRENIIRKYYDISGGIVYAFSPQTKLSLKVGYRKQQGPGINLDLLTALSQFTTVYRKLYFTVGVDLYQRDYLDQLKYYNGVFVQLSRKF